MKLSQLVCQRVLCKFVVCIVLSSFFDCTESSIDGFYFMPNGTVLTKVDENESSRLGAICGRSSSKRQYPWSVSLALHGFNKLNGVIISNRHIITVAHGFLRFDNSKHGACVVINYKEFQTIAMKRVLYGSDCIHFARTWKSLPPKCNQTKLQTGLIRAVAIDHRFAEGRCINGHDWAIIELEKPMTFNDYISPICLPFARQPIRPILTAAGWGRPSAFENTDPRITEKLMRYDETCTAPITDSMPTHSEDYLCTKSLDPTNPLSSRVCHGDSGSGLQQSDSNGITNTLVGLTSFGTNGCPANELARFTRVSNYVDTICQLTGVHFKFVYQLEHRATQMLQFKFSLEDESIFVYSESCAYVPYCNQNQSLAYFQPSRSRSFTTNDHLFDGSIRGRSGPTGKTGRDSINLNGFNSTTEFGLVDRSTFPVQGDGVFGLGLIADPQRFQRSFLYHLLRAVPFPQIGFTVWPNRNLSIPNSGLMIVGQQLTVGCVNDYQFVFLQYPQKQWIFAIKNVQYDSIFLSTDQQWSTSIQPGRFYTIAPDVFLTSFYSYIRAIQPDSRIDDYYVMNNKDDGPPMPDVTFEIGALQLTLTSRDYLSEMTSKGRLVLFKKRPIDYGGLETDWVFGDNFLQRYCVLLEYTTNPRIGFALSVDGSRSTKINRLYSVFPNLDEDCRLIRGGGFHAQFLTDPIMSWKETDPLKVWANSSIVPVNPKPKDSDDELITRERSTVIQAIQEMRGEDQDRYLATLVQNWPFKWEKRAFEVPGHVAALTCGSTGLYIGVKTAGEAFHPGMNYGLIQIIRRTSKSAVIPPCYISLMTAFALWTVYIKRPIMRDGDVCSSCMLYRGLAISVGSGVFVPMISAPYLSHAVASYQEAANTQPRNLLERLALIVEYNKPIVRHVPKLLAVHLAVSAICVYSTLWGWRHIYQTMDVDPDFVREAVEKEPIETGFVHRIRHKIINTVDYINSL